MAKQEDQVQAPVKKTPVFVGKSALVRLVNGTDTSNATIWLVDSSNKTLRPFISEDQFEMMFKDAEQAKKAVTTLSSDELGPHGLLGDFHILDSSYGVQGDGSMKNVEFSPSQIQQRYGKSVDEGAENKAISQLDGLMSSVSGGEIQPNMDTQNLPPTDQSTPPDSAPLGTGGPGSGTVYEGEEGMIYDGQGGPNLQSGSHGPDVLALQQQLLSMGYLTQEEYDTGPGIFGPRTLNAIKEFQTAQGLTPDGVVGPLTQGKLSSYNNPPANGSNPPAGNTGGWNRDTGLPSMNTNFYGQPGNTSGTAPKQTLEKGILQGSMNLAAQPNSGSSLKLDFLQKIQNDPLLIAFYVNAMAYGGYDITDVYKDLSRVQQAEGGNTSMQNMTLIHPTMTRSIYWNTDAGQKAFNDGENIVPLTDTMRAPGSYLSKAMAGIPDSVFAEQNKPPAFGTPEWRDAVANIQSGYFDLLTAQVSANTEQEKALADYNLTQFNKSVETKLGISLSDNSMKAWQQIQALEQGYNDRGIQGSGLENKAIDDQLKSVRTNDTINRSQTLTQEQQKRSETMKTAGSAAEIAAMTPEERQALGLTPSAEALNSFSLSNIKEKLGPNTTDDQAKAYRDKFIDENGNYRSTLYQKKYQSMYDLNYHTPTDTNREDYQTNLLIQQYADKKTAADDLIKLPSTDPSSPDFMKKPPAPPVVTPPNTINLNTTTPPNNTIPPVRPPAVKPNVSHTPYSPSVRPATPSVTPPPTYGPQRPTTPPVTPPPTYGPQRPAAPFISPLNPNRNSPPTPPSTPRQPQTWRDIVSGLRNTFGGMFGR